MPGDLHTHTTFSDGGLPAARLPQLARSAGLTDLAISDHDSCRAVDYARRHPVQQGIRLLPATELTAFDFARNRRVHLLCYLPAECAALRQFCDTMAARRNAVCGQSLQELKALYPQFSEELAYSFAQDGGVLFKAHLIQVLYEFGYTDGIYKDLYRELFGKEGRVLHDPAYETVETVLEVMRQAKAVAVLAHPSVYHSMELAAELAAAGAIDGVEIEHPRNTPADKAQLRALAKQYGLIMTGGSDFHGIYSSRPCPLGCCATNDETLARIRALAKRRQEG